MESCMITFRSVTPAQRGELALRRAGIYCAIGRTPRVLAEQGCGYSLRVNRPDLPEALELLRVKGISFRKAYCTDPEGNPGEIVL